MASEGCRGSDALHVWALPAPLSLPRRLLFVAGWFSLSLVLVIPADWRYLMFIPNDWQVWTWVPEWIQAGELYATEHYIVWAPPMMWLLAFVVVPLGYAWWWAAHFLSLLTIERSVALLAVLSVPFWADAMNGQTVTFQFVAGAIALSGRTALPFLVLAVLIPRPLVLPLLVYLLWKRPETRLPFGIIALAVLGASALSGDLLPWVGNLFTMSGANYHHFANISPTKVMGAAWLLIGIPLAVWLTWKGRVGLAGLAVSPYILPFYPLVLLWERPTSSSRPDSPSARPTR